MAAKRGILRCEVIPSALGTKWGAVAATPAPPPPSQFERRLPPNQVQTPELLVGLRILSAECLADKEFRPFVPALRLLRHHQGWGRPKKFFPNNSISFFSSMALGLSINVNLMEDKKPTEHKGNFRAGICYLASKCNKEEETQTQKSGRVKATASSSLSSTSLSSSSRQRANKQQECIKQTCNSIVEICFRFIQMVDDVMNVPVWD
ncbi:hypothetical protein FF38_07312 [Lucilia cuprina]|uniref:Uncharacterized protein n=1 Tax=Lucilia cuprina TaxID=7375 RepID=A0A0L0BQP7_LUCCU|nr:hypothetical protein FF38_07312 [Lucilia cuprina]